MISRDVKRFFGLILTATVVIVACASGPDPSSTSDPNRPSDPPIGEPGLTPPGRPGGIDLVLFGGPIVPLDDAEGSDVVEALGIDGDRIAAVGSLEDVMAISGQDTVIVDLEGRAVYPGFIDAHSHWYQPGRLGDLTPEQVNQVLLSRGWTGTNELNVHPSYAEHLFAIAEEGRMALRVNGYLAVNGAGNDQIRFGDWWTERGITPGALIGDRLRIPGIKIFIASDWDRSLKWTQDELNAEVARQDAAGWQIALKQLSDESLDMVLEAIAATQTTDPGHDRRFRLEHAFETRPDQIDKVRTGGLLPIVQLGGLEADLQSEDGMREIVADDGLAAAWPWQDLLSAGIPVVGSIAVAPANGLQSAFTISAAQMIHGAMTGLSETGNAPWPGRESQLLTLSQAIRALTIDAAFSTFEEDERGSLRAGKLADLTIFSEDLRPAATEPERLRSLSVAATLIGGELMWCGYGLDGWCASFGQAVPTRLVDATALAPLVESGDDPGAVPVPDDLFASVSASASRAGHGPALAVDGDLDTFWSSGMVAPQWLRLDLRSPANVSAVRLVVFQNPAGATIHRLEVLVAGSWATVESFAGPTQTGQVLEWRPSTPVADVEAIRVTTESSDSWPEWLEIGIDTAP